MTNETDQQMVATLEAQLRDLDRQVAALQSEAKLKQQAADEVGKQRQEVYDLLAHVKEK